MLEGVQLNYWGILEKGELGCIGLIWYVLSLNKQVKVLWIKSTGKSGFNWEQLLLLWTIRLWLRKKQIFGRYCTDNYNTTLIAELYWLEVIRLSDCRAEVSARTATCRWVSQAIQSLHDTNGFDFLRHLRLRWLWLRSRWKMSSPRLVTAPRLGATITSVCCAQDPKDLSLHLLVGWSH